MDEKMNERELDQLETEEEFLAHYDLRKYDPVAATTDLAIFTIRNNRLCVLLIQRGGHPAKGKWALPGGFVNVDESLDEGAARELKEETGLTIDEGYLEQLKTYAWPGRDPRGYIVSTAYVALAPKIKKPIAADDAAAAHFFPVEEVLAEFDLPFGHEVIIRDGLERVRAKMEYAPIAHLFLEDSTFTMSELRRVYEIVWGQELLASNFRRKVQSVKGFVIPVGDKRPSQVEGGRASDLYRAGDLSIIFPPLRRQEQETEA